MSSSWVLEGAEKKQPQGAVKDRFNIIYLSSSFRGLFLENSAQVPDNSILVSDLPRVGLWWWKPLTRRMGGAAVGSGSCCWWKCWGQHALKLRQTPATAEAVSAKKLALCWRRSSADPELRGGS